MMRLGVLGFPTPARLAFLLVGLACLLISSSRLMAQDPADDGARLQLVTWEASFFGQSQPGIACWLTSPEGALRLEVLPTQDRRLGLSDLLEQNGEGFTLVLGAGRSGTFNPWRQEWRAVDAAAAGWIHLVAGVLAGQDPRQLALAQDGRLLETGSRHQAPRPRFFTTSSGSLPAVHRVQLPSLEKVAEPKGASPGQGPVRPVTSFHRQMALRGQGRGGGQEILTLKPAPGPGESAWSLTSSRKPGRLTLSNPEVWVISEPGPEVFAPLWPLNQLVDLGEKIRELR